MNRRNFFKLAFGTLGVLVITAAFPKSLIANTPEVPKYIPGVITYPPFVEPFPGYSMERVNMRILALKIEKCLTGFVGEFNDRTTRRKIVTQTQALLENYKARRAFNNYRVVCDESNNTPELIDKNSAVTDIWIQPKKELKFYQLTVTMTPRGADFKEILQ